MLGTLKLISFISVAVAICCVGYAGYLIVNDSNEAGGVLGQPSKIEGFIATAKSGDTNEPDAKDSLLVKQAQAYSLRINPPAPPTPKKKKTVLTDRIPTVSGPSGPPPIAKFKVVGVSVAKNNVKNSKVLVDTLSQGLRWLSISDKIGRVEVSDILRDYIVIDDGSKTYNMDVPRKKRISLLKGDPDNPYRKEYEPVDRGGDAGDKGSSRRRGRGRSARKPISTVAVDSTPPLPSAGQIKENIEFIKQLAMDPESMGLSKEESESMGDMAQFLGDMNKELEAATQREAAEKADKRLKDAFESKRRPVRPVSPKDSKANVEFLKKIAADPKSMGISKEEAEKLGELKKAMKEFEAEAEKKTAEPAKKK